MSSLKSLYIFLFICTTSRALSLLDIHQAQMSSPYFPSNLQTNEDDTIFVDPEADQQNSKGPVVLESKSIPIIEAPVAISNPIWNLISRAGEFYRIFRRNSDDNNPPTMSPRWKVLRV